MKKIIVLSILINFTVVINAQQLPLYSQYQQNSYLLNPAFSGSSDYSPLRLTLRKQWMGFTEMSPETKALSLHHKLDNMGMGGFIYNDRAGNFSRTGIQLSYAYHFPLSENTFLSLGVAGNISQWTLDQSNYENLELNDPLITYSRDMYYLPDADAGLLLYNPDFFVSLSASQLLEYRFNAGFSEFDNNHLQRHLFFYGGYNLAAGDNLTIQPSLFLQYAQGKNMVYDVNAKFILQQSYWLGLTYRNTEAAAVQAGIIFKNFLLGYSFDFTYGKISEYGSGTHEIVLGYNFGFKNNSSKPVVSL